MLAVLFARGVSSLANGSAKVGRTPSVSSKGPFVCLAAVEARTCLAEKTARAVVQVMLSVCTLRKAYLAAKVKPL